MRVITVGDTNNRIVFIDYVRAMATIMVIMCHVVDVNCMFWSGFQEMVFVRQVILYAILTFGRCGVPLFLLITGYLLLDRDYGDGRWKNFYIKKWLYLLVVTEIWFAVYEAFFCIVLGNPFHVNDFLLRLLMVKEPVLSHAWYLPMILKIYLVIPIISVMLRKISSKHIFPLVVSVLVINGILQMMGQRSMVITEFASDILYLSYVIIGYVIKRFREMLMKNRAQRERYTGLVGTCIGVAMISFVGCEWFLIKQYERGEAVNLWYDNICVIVMSITVFLGMSLLSNKRECRVVQQLSADSFGIYLIHNMIALAMMDALGSWEISLYVKIVVSYIVILFVSVLLNKLIEIMPYIGKWVLYKKS